MEELSSKMLNEHLRELLDNVTWLASIKLLSDVLVSLNIILSIVNTDN